MQPKTFHNIFSNSPTKTETITCPNPKIPITIDTREKQSLISANLVEKKANINFEKLEIGDYLIEDTIIERKTFSDFISSTLDKRLQEQLINLKKYPKHFLIIEGFYYNYKNTKANIHENAIRGMFLSVALDFQVPIIYTEDEEDTANFLILVAKKYERPNTEISSRPSRNFKSQKERKQFILEGFPGIGPKTSKQLIEELSSLQQIFNASKEQLRLITSWDESKIENFKQLLE
jgi:Fanconi anemia group M protein